jgi:hypothetical protein
MENRVLFLIVAILLMFALFSKSGVGVIKNLIGVANGTTGTTGVNTDGTFTATDTGKTYSGGVDSKTISSGILAG